MSIFGWPYPPGCNGTPFDENHTCEVCGGFPDVDCICKECNVCGDYGNPICYKEHGLIKSNEQINQLKQKQKEWDEENTRQYENEQKMLDEHYKYLDYPFHLNDNL